MHLDEKVALITGASSGIGAATARVLAAAGSLVVLVSRSESDLERVASALDPSRCLVAPADVAQRTEVNEAVAHAVRHFGRVDIVINNAGVGIPGRVADVRADLFAQAIGTNVLGPVHVIQAAVPFMRGAGGGLIVNVSSMTTRVAIAGAGAYRATKLALDAISDACRLELRHDNIRVVTVYPGLTATNFFENALGASPGTKRAVPRRWRDPECVACRIVAAARREPRSMYMGPRGALAAVAARLFPRLLERIAGW